MSYPYSCHIHNIIFILTTLTPLKLRSCNAIKIQLLLFNQQNMQNCIYEEWKLLYHIKILRNHIYQFWRRSAKWFDNGRKSRFRFSYMQVYDSRRIWQRKGLTGLAFCSLPHLFVQTWTDARLRWDPSRFRNQNILVVPAGDIWLPDTGFRNRYFYQCIGSWMTYVSLMMSKQRRS